MQRRSTSARCCREGDRASDRGVFFSISCALCFHLVRARKHSGSLPSRGQLTLRVRTANGPGFDLPHLPLLSAARICSRGFSASRPRACVPQGPKPQPTFCAYLYPRAATARCVLSICICPHAYHRYRPYGYVVADTVQLVTGWPIGQPGSPLPTRSHAHARGRAARSKGRTGLVTASDPPSRNRRQVSLAARGSRLDHTAARAQSHARLAQSYIQRQEQSCCLPVPCRAAPRQTQARPPSLRSPEEATPSQEGPAFARASPRRDADTENFSPAVSGRLRGAGTSYRDAGARMPVPVPVRPCVRARRRDAAAGQIAQRRPRKKTVPCDRASAREPEDGRRLWERACMHSMGTARIPRFLPKPVLALALRASGPCWHRAVIAIGGTLRTQLDVCITNAQARARLPRRSLQLQLALRVSSTSRRRSNFGTCGISTPPAACEHHSSRTLACTSGRAGVAYSDTVRAVGVSFRG